MIEIGQRMVCYPTLHARQQPGMSCDIIRCRVGATVLLHLPAVTASLMSLQSSEERWLFVSLGGLRPHRLKLLELYFVRFKRTQHKRTNAQTYTHSTQILITALHCPPRIIDTTHLYFGRPLQFYSPSQQQQSQANRL